MRLNLIGCGKLGKTLGRLLVDNNQVSLAGVYNPRLASAQVAVDFIGSGRAMDNLACLEQADLYFLAVPDDKILPCLLEILKQHRPKTNAGFVHFSGAQPHEILNIVQDFAAWGANVHPLKTFAAPELAVKNFAGTWCGVSGDPRGLAILEPIFAAIGAQLFEIASENKIMYHAAAVFASNYVLTLGAVAEDCLIQAGVSKKIALKIIASLISSTADDLGYVDNSFAQALTGPLMRGDVKVVQKHLSALPAEYKDLYIKLAKTLSQLAKLKPEILDDLILN